MPDNEANVEDLNEVEGAETADTTKVDELDALIKGMKNHVTGSGEELWEFILTKIPKSQAKTGQTLVFSRIAKALEVKKKLPAQLIGELSN
jgi:hypothetical protein